MRSPERDKRRGSVLRGLLPLLLAVLLIGIVAVLFRTCQGRGEPLPERGQDGQLT